MRRRAKPAKAKVEAKLLVARKAPKSDGAKLRDLEKRLAEALEQQTATAEILGIISRSPADAQPVFDAIASRVVRLCDGFFSTVWRYDGTLIHHAADNYPREEMRATLTKGYPAPAQPGSVVAQAISEGRIIHVEDLLDDSAPPASRGVAIALGYRTLLCVPMLRDSVSIGAIAVARQAARPFSDRQIELVKTFADQAVIAIENVRLFKETKEALERQTATSEILSVISSSPTDIQPVLDTVVESAARLCEAYDATIFLRGDADRLVLAANNGPIHAAAIGAYTLSLNRGTVGGRTMLEARTIHISDLQAEAEEFPEAAGNARRLGFHTMLSVPLMREGVAIGAIQLPRREVRPFTERQVALLQTFADQAVIAIENVRLFNETKEALEQQTATSDILKVISSSPTDVQPVFDPLLDSAIRLCGATHASLYRVENDLIRHVAARGSVRGPLSLGVTAPIPRGTAPGQAILTGQIVQVADAQNEVEDMPSNAREFVIREGVRTVLAVPLLRERVSIGVIVIRRTEVRLFAESEIRLLKTFADQAVIAIENVRLFNETKEALEQQTATSEILRVISQSQTDVQPVFDAVLASGVRLCGATFGGVFRFDGELVHFVTAYRWPAQQLEAVRRHFPMPPGDGSLVGRAIRDRRVVQTPDYTAEAHVMGWFAAGDQRPRGTIAIPMLREGNPIGGIVLARGATGLFSDEHVALLQTFADQAVIAIENVRLFKELEVANRALEAASQHKSEFLANMSHELRTPLNAIIGFSEVLSERMFGELNEKQDEYLKDIYASGQHLLSLINDILDLSKIEAGRMELELTDFDLPQAIDNALILVRERAGRRGIALEHSVDERLGEIRGDERKVKQVLLNLLSNALKFTPEGGRVEVRARMMDGKAEISVTDTGVGIALEDQGAIFEEFRQVGTSEKKAEGTGLGLTLCQKFIELHGGRIWVKSQVGVGSTFTFTIPVRRGE